MPKCLYRSCAGAEAPNPRMPMKAPSGPSHLSQPNAAAASTPTRGRRAQDRIPIALALRLEQLPAGHGHHRGADPLPFKRLGRLDRQGQLRARADQRHVARALAARSAHRRPWPTDSPDVCVVRRSGTPWRVSARIVGVALARSASSQHSAHSIAIGRPHDVEIGHGAQRGEMLDRLVGRAVLAKADRIVGHDVDHPLPHQRREADRRAAIVGEDQEGAAIRHDPAVQREPIHGRRHAVLAHAVMDVVAGEVAGLDDAMLFGQGANGAGEVGGAADETRDERQELLQHLLRGLPRRKLGAFAGEVRLDRGDRGHDRRPDLARRWDR